MCLKASFALLLNQFSSVAQLFSTVCNPMDCSTPGFHVHHQLPEFTQTHVLQVGDAIQPSHPLSSPSPPAFNFFQHQGLFQWVSSSHQVAKVLEFQLQNQSFQPMFRTDFHEDWLIWSPCSRRDSPGSSLTSQFKSISSSALSFLYNPTPYMTTGKTIALTRWTFVRKVMSLLFNTLSRFATAFLPRSKCLLILWLKSHHMQWFWSPRSEICHCLYCFPVYLAWSDGIRYYDLRYLNAEF